MTGLGNGIVYSALKVMRLMVTFRFIKYGNVLSEIILPCVL